MCFRLILQLASNNRLINNMACCLLMMKPLRYVIRYSSHPPWTQSVYSWLCSLLNPTDELFHIVKVVPFLCKEAQLTSDVSFPILFIIIWRISLTVITESEDELSFTESPVKSSHTRRSTFLPPSYIGDIETDSDSVSWTFYRLKSPWTRIGM